MHYEEKTTQTISYDYVDIINWIKTFAARQLGITPDEITEDQIQITPENVKSIDITVSYTKTVSNKKDQ